MDPRAASNILKWGVQNSDSSRNDPAIQSQPRVELNPDDLAALMGGAVRKSEFDLMHDAMKIIESPDASLDKKKEAFEDFELYVGQIDNANNLENKHNEAEQVFWTRLLDQLKQEEADLRKYAAWCVGTAVQNNPRQQEKLLVLGAIPTLVQLATEDIDHDVRWKAVGALSSASRNFQPSLDAIVEHVPAKYKPEGKLNAADMDSVDSLIHKIRADVQKK
ncbi:Hsp70 nucleotide exchange factor FES1 [Delitschia confertaspora ATCC 74209]|uniref:Hsp70 nucleotide exchange factor FES1 n=1 Tax=Delitschia confertaspora ATCC 74209 TaxID=1513339 RepID=A0A9P4JUY4_9PLEO|nr:Hsp70 nucleotide exchange factor FES1 [Delitschia confertaspora ATCC 74209]